MRWNRRDMASMNNSFAYIRYHIGRDRNFLILYGIVLVCLFPLLALGLQNNLKTRECLMILLFLLMAVMCVMALVLPVYLFHFLWNRREMDLYASVGMKRKTFYAHKYGIGVADDAAASQRRHGSGRAGNDGEDLCAGPAAVLAQCVDRHRLPFPSRCHPDGRQLFCPAVIADPCPADAAGAACFAARILSAI